MTDTQQRVDLVVRTIAQTAIDNETYFGDLDSVVGDGDFGYSLARGFEKVIEGWDDIDRTNPGTFLKKVGMIVSSRIGGTSGPIWGTAFMKAGITAGTAETLTGDDVVAMLRAATDGIKMRGQSDVGDKTLLDALVPMTERIDAELKAGTDPAGVLAAAAATARQAAEATIRDDRETRAGVLHGGAEQGFGRRRCDGGCRISWNTSARRGQPREKS